MTLDQSSYGRTEAAEKQDSSIEPFRLTLGRHDLELSRGETTTLQINVGLACNQTCRHCHLEASPTRKEMMNAETVDQVVAFAERCRFEIVDITGGAPELNPNLASLIESLSGVVPKTLLRSNLTALSDADREHLLEVCQAHHVAIVASFPSLNEAQTESQRGRGVFRRSIALLQRLNYLGYGQPESPLELNLVSNPTGAFLPSSQEQVEKRFRQVLEQKWGIVFNNLFAFANAPLGRFRKWLERSGNLETYIEKLAASFNPCAIEGLMCRTLVSVSWNGYLYDCDFNQARGLHMGARKTHISEINQLPEPGTPIAVSDHCYTCTAGTGFT